MLKILNTHLHTILYLKLDLFSEDKNTKMWGGGGVYYRLAHFIPECIICPRT